MRKKKLLQRIVDLDKENKGLKSEIEKLEDIIALLREKYAAIDIKIQETKRSYHDLETMGIHSIKHITIPQSTICVPLDTKFAFSEVLNG